MQSEAKPVESQAGQSAGEVSATLSPTRAALEREVNVAGDGEQSVLLWVVDGWGRTRAQEVASCEPALDASTQGELRNQPGQEPQNAAHGLEVIHDPRHAEIQQIALDMGSAVQRSENPELQDSRDESADNPTSVDAAQTAAAAVASGEAST